MLKRVHEAVLILGLTFGAMIEPQAMEGEGGYRGARDNISADGHFDNVFERAFDAIFGGKRSWAAKLERDRQNSFRSDGTGYTDGRAHCTGNRC